MKRAVQVLVAVLTLGIGTTAILYGLIQSPVTADEPGFGAIKLDRFLKAQSLEDLFVIDLPKFLIGVAGVVALVFLLINAFKYLLGSGNDQTVAEAKQGLVFSVIGLAIVVFAYAIVSAIKGQLGG